MINGYEIYKSLILLGIKSEDFEWVDDFDDFNLLISIILAQNTNWKNVLKALEKLKKAKITGLDALLALPLCELEALIRSSGTYKIKAKRLINLGEKIQKDFKDLATFKEEVKNSWLLNIKGIGPESCDAILNYLCKKELLVVDAYTARLGAALDFSFEDYYDLQEFFQSGIEAKQDELNKLLGKKYNLSKLYAHFHALIISFCKKNLKGKEMDKELKQSLINML